MECHAPSQVLSFVKLEDAIVVLLKDNQETDDRNIIKIDQKMANFSGK